MSILKPLQRTDGRPDRRAKTVQSGPNSEHSVYARLAGT